MSTTASIDLEFSLGQHPDSLEIVLHHRDRIALFPFRFFLAGTVGARVRMRMSVPAIGLGFDQRRAIAGPGAFNRFSHCAAHSQDVHAIHHFTGDTVGAGAGGDIRQLARLDPGDRHGIQVVFADKNDREVPQAGHVQRFVEVARIRGAFAEETQDHPLGPHNLLGERRADCHRNIAADDAGSAQVAVLHIGDVHRAAFAFAVASRFAQYFGHHFVVMVLLGFERFGNFIAVGMGVPVAAVGAGDQVIIAKCSHRADCDRFLPGIQV